MGFQNDSRFPDCSLARRGFLLELLACFSLRLVNLAYVGLLLLSLTYARYAPVYSRRRLRLSLPAHVRLLCSARVTRMTRCTQLRECHSQVLSSIHTRSKRQWNIINDEKEQLFWPARLRIWEPRITHKHKWPAHVVLRLKCYCQTLGDCTEGCMSVSWRLKLDASSTYVLNDTLNQTNLCVLAREIYWIQLGQWKSTCSPNASVLSCASRAFNCCKYIATRRENNASQRTVMCPQQQPLNCQP